MIDLNCDQVDTLRTKLLWEMNARSEHIFRLRKPNKLSIVVDLITVTISVLGVATFNMNFYGYDQEAKLIFHFLAVLAVLLVMWKYVLKTDQKADGHNSFLDKNIRIINRIEKVLRVGKMPSIDAYNALLEEISSDNNEQKLLGKVPLKRKQKWTRDNLKIFMTHGMKCGACNQSNEVEYSWWNIKLNKRCNSCGRTTQ